MLKKRIIPCLDVKNGSVVKGVGFQNLRWIGDPVELGKRYAEEGADELVYYDIGATIDNKELTLSMIERIAADIRIPFTVGGGIRKIKDIYALLSAGADKISINTAAISDSNLISQASKAFGSQCVVLSMDIKEIQDGKWMVHSHGGSKITDIEACQWALDAETLGAGELVVNVISTDGMKKGYEIGILRRLSELVGIPVIASGGAGKMEDFYEVFCEGNVDGALAASVFHESSIEIPELKKYLWEREIKIRRAFDGAF